tara:strand:- start:5918 stop:7696 length:1779 start_codon:yes stop_codon:yes gene_type:complete
MSNYLSGSPFGQVAGSLLSQKNRRNRKQRNQALILAALFEAFGVRQKQQFETKKENINELNDQYGDIIEINKANYNDPSAVKERNLYKQWLNEDTRNSAINAKAIDYFNSMPALAEQFGPNAYAAVQQLSLTTNDANIQGKFAEDMALAKEYAKQYFTNIETDETGQYKVIKTPNIVEFNADVKRAYKAALNEVKNDPTKKGVLRELFVKTFGRDKEGNPRFGMIHQDNLTNERERLEKEAGITRTETDFGYNLSLGIYTDDILDNTINSADSEEGEERTWLTWSSTDKAAGTSDDNTTTNVNDAFAKYPIPIKGDASPIDSHVTELNYFLHTGGKEKDEAERAKTHLTANKNDGKYMMEVDGEETNIYDYYINLPSGDAKLIFMDDILTRSRKLQQAYESGGGTEVKSPAYFVDAALLDYIENNHVGVRAENVVLDIDLQEMISVTFNGEPLEIKIGEIVGRVADKKHPKYFHNSEDARAYIDAFEGLNPRHQEFLEKSFTDVHAPNEPITRDIFGKIGDIISETVGYKSSFQKNADMKLLVEYMEGEFINPVRLKAVLERHNLDEDKNTVKQFLTAEGVEFDSGSGFPLF